MSITITTLKIQYEQDTVLARQRARLIAEMLGFESREQTAIATAVSEIVRNAFNYAKDSSVEFIIDEQAIPQVLLINIKDQGPGIEDVNKILEGRYHSKTGLGIGISGSRKLMDIFHIKTSEKGTTVLLGKKLPAEKLRITVLDIRNITDELIKQKAKTPIEEVKEQNQELLTTLDEVRKKQEELLRLNKELEETNRGVVALYAELDERAEHLKSMNEIKARFFSNMSHEFKTPLNSIAALSRLLIESTDGPLNEEQSKQVRFIQKSTNDLYEIVNDLLDIAKLEAGKITVKPEYFEIKDLFASLRGIMRPLLSNKSVNLIFEEPEQFPLMFSDETKIAQILRNFISNALKFTEKGEVKIRAELNSDNVIFSVTDTGIGIAEKDIDYIFEEFSQVDNNLQKHVRGTGLGLPLSKKLAHTLGGDIKVESKLGTGSVFYAVIPLNYSLEIKPDLSFSEVKLNTVKSKPFRIHAVSKPDAENPSPDMIILEVLMPAEDIWSYLEELRANEHTRNTPIIILTSPQIKGEISEKYSGVSGMVSNMKYFKKNSGITKVLIIDDEEIPRYVLKEMLPPEYFEIIEAETGKSGIEKAIEEQPDIIFLDIMMPDQNGFEVLIELNKNEATRKIPVIINSSRQIGPEETKKLIGSASIINKENFTQEELLQKISNALVIYLQQGFKVQNE